MTSLLFPGFRGRGGFGDRGRGRGGGGGGGDRNSGGNVLNVFKFLLTDSNSSVGRDGDWNCGDASCGNMNFAFRQECHRCNKPRTGGEGQTKRFGNSNPRSYPTLIYNGLLLI